MKDALLLVDVVNDVRHMVREPDREWPVVLKQRDETRPPDVPQPVPSPDPAPAPQPPPGEPDPGPRGVRQLV